MSKSEQVHVHRMSGCRPTPLAHYLKALGILRLVAEQVDSKARGWWQDDVFHLATQIDRESLEAFFLNDYAPTPMTAPWLSRSGYSDESSHTKTREWLTQILNVDHPRFDSFRDCVQQFQAYADKFGYNLSEADSMRTPEFISFARGRVGASTRLWIDTCIIPVDEKVSYPAIFGTGGNEGSGSYLANYYQALVVSLNLKQDSFCAAVFDNSVAANFLPTSSQHNAGHYSESTGVNGPWNYILALEGALLLTSSLTRRIDATRPNSVAGTSASLSSPFSVSNDCVGYASSSVVDSKSNRQGKLVPGRGEQWMPLWNSPCRLAELQQVFREGRSTIRRRAASRSRDFCLSIARSGVARGISAFERYGYLQRNGDNHMAVSLGRFQVEPRPNQRLLDEVALWIDRLRQTASDKLAPQSIVRSYRACELAVFNCATRASGADFLALLVALGGAEDQILASPRFSADKCSPLPKLSGQWLSAVGQDSSEFRLALALAAQHGPLKTKSRWAPIRSHWLPLDATGARFEKGEQGLNIGPDQSALGLDLTRAALAVMHRRLLALSRGATEGFIPLKLVSFRFGARLDDIHNFVNRRTDDARILSYARGLMSLRFDDAEVAPQAYGSNSTPLGGLALYGVFRLALPVDYVSLPGDQKVSIRCNPTVFNRLQTGDFSGAFQLAVRQLSNAGLRPKLLLGTGTPDLAQRLAASMVFGVAPNGWTRLALALTDPQLPVEAINDEANESSTI